ncbi:MAG: 50S ribosomal protein L5 [Candidatus Methanomethyliales bacterium]|nr:50S ribosomal protein L5 [Candidatus Methanomethylicales archaeon]
MSEGAKATEVGQSNPMRSIRIGKVVVNIGVGEGGERLEKAMTVLESLTGAKPCPRRAKKTIRDFGVRRGENIGCVVTLRGEKVEDFLRRAFDSRKNRLKESSFDDYGNISFGITEHINLPGTKYDPSLGIFGMNVCIVLERPGYRVSRRRYRPSKIGRNHRVTKEEAIAFMTERFGIKVERGA